MAKFLVAVQGKVLIEADDKDQAVEILKGRLAEDAPWLSKAYGDPERLADLDELHRSNRVYVPA